MDDVRQLFSRDSDIYAAARPTYPPAMFAYLARQCAYTERAWDCATGSGQAARDLARWFDRVDATDVSTEQIHHAQPHERIVYAVHPAEATDFPAACFDLVTVAQALHWFDHARFWPEVHRVLKPGGIFAAWAYTWPRISPDIDTLVGRALLASIYPYWAPQNRLSWDGYANLEFPFAEVPAPKIAMSVEWNTSAFLRYISTWSATRKCIEDQGTRFFESFAEALYALWPSEQTRLVKMDFWLRVGRHEPPSASP